MLKATILSISMATVMAGAAISPGLGLIAQAFPDASTTTIKLILTAPSLMIIPFSFLSSYLTSKIRKRTIALLGIFIYFIGGIMPQFMPTIEWILAFRLLLGVGVGLIMPLDASLINDYFEGKERTAMMGYNSALSNFSGIVTMIFAGWLATFGWRLPFNVYFLGLLIFALVFFYLPKGQVQKAPKTNVSFKIPLAVFGYSFAMGGIMLAYYAVATNMAIFLEQNNIGNATLTGIIVSLTTVGGMITSLLIVQIEFFFKKYVLHSMLFSMGLGFLLLTWTSNLALIMMAVVLIGFGQGILFPILTLKALDKVPFHKADITASITASFIFLGQFLSPLVLDNIGKLTTGSSIRFQYGFLAISIFMSVGLLFIFQKRKMLS